LGVHRERHSESVSRLEVLAGPSGKRHWSDALKGRIVAETLVPGVAVNEVARRHDMRTLNLSSWRGLARAGKLVVPDLADISFASIVLALSNPVGFVPGQIELCSGGITLRLDSATDALRIAELVAALQAAVGGQGVSDLLCNCGLVHAS